MLGSRYAKFCGVNFPAEIQDVLTLPIIAHSALIAFVESGNPFVWQGYLYAAGLFVVSVLGCLFMHHSFNISYNVGMRIRTAVITAVYRKVSVRVWEGGMRAQ